MGNGMRSCVTFPGAPFVAPLVWRPPRLIVASSTRHPIPKPFRSSAMAVFRFPVFAGLSVAFIRFRKRPEKCHSVRRVVVVVVVVLPTHFALLAFRHPLSARYRSRNSPPDTTPDAYYSQEPSSLPALLIFDIPYRFVCFFLRFASLSSPS